MGVRNGLQTLELFYVDLLLLYAEMALELFALTIAK